MLADELVSLELATVFSREAVRRTLEDTSRVLANTGIQRSYGTENRSLATLTPLGQCERTVSNEYSIQALSLEP